MYYIKVSRSHTNNEGSNGGGKEVFLGIGASYNNTNGSNTAGLRKTSAINNRWNNEELMDEETKRIKRDSTTSGINGTASLWWDAIQFILSV